MCASLQAHTPFEYEFRSYAGTISFRLNGPLANTKTSINWRGEEAWKHNLRTCELKDERTNICIFLRKYVCAVTRYVLLALPRITSFRYQTLNYHFFLFCTLLIYTLTFLTLSKILQNWLKALTHMKRFYNFVIITWIRSTFNDLYTTFLWTDFSIFSHHLQLAFQIIPIENCFFARDPDSEHLSGHDLFFFFLYRHQTNFKIS